MLTPHPKSSRTGKTLTRVAMGLGLVGACTVVDKGDYTFTDNPDATGGEESGGGTGGAQGGTSGNAGTSTTAGEGGEPTGGRGGTSSGTGGDAGSGTSGDGGGGTGGSGDGCDPPCENDGVCTSSGTCDCAPGWEGDTCEDDIDECEPNPCKNGIACVNLQGDFKCDCPPNLTGKVCELFRFEPIVNGPRSYARSVSADGTVVLGAFYNGDGMERPYFWTSGSNPMPAAVPSEFRQAHVTPEALSGNGLHWVGTSQQAAMTGAQPMPAGGTQAQFGMFAAPTTGFTGAIRDTNDNGSKSVGYVDEGAAMGIHAFSWDSGGRPSPLTPPMIGAMSLNFTAGAVTRDGTIATGGFFEPMGRWYVVPYVLAGGTTAPPIVAVNAGTTNVTVTGVSADGQVSVGWYVDAAQAEAAFVTQQTRFNNITPMAGPVPAPSRAWDISDDGTVVVGEFDPSGMSGMPSFQACVWTGQPPLNHTPLELILRNANVDLMGHRLVNATGVSADGKVVVGEALNMAGDTVGYIARLP